MSQICLHGHFQIFINIAGIDSRKQNSITSHIFIIYKNKLKFNTISRNSINMLKYYKPLEDINLN